jgi:glycosyltransferase involved in cell wall biosynthesis
VSSQRRVAHFLLNPNLLGSPPNQAYQDLLTELDIGIDYYSTWSDQQLALEDGVRRQRVNYGPRWLLRHSLSQRWRSYSAFSGTTEDPIGIAGPLARLWRRPLIVFADEIRNGSYAGLRSARWKAHCRRGMGQAQLTVVNEAERLSIQRDYANLAQDKTIIVYPGAFHAPPPPAERQQVRAARGIPADALVLCYSGTFNHGNGGAWLAQALGSIPNLHVWGQIMHGDPLIHDLLRYLQGSERLHLESGLLGWRQAWSVSAAADIGMVVYLQDAPQFRHMGIASNRLCMFLSMGVPVIANRQPSFEFIERYDCGVLVENAAEMPAAIAHMAERLKPMRENALRCARDHINASGRYQELSQRIGALVAPH